MERLLETMFQINEFKTLVKKNSPLSSSQQNTQESELYMIDKSQMKAEQCNLLCINICLQTDIISENL